MSNTPRTDAIAIAPNLSVTSEYSAMEIHARQLETELAAKDATIAKLRDEIVPRIQQYLGNGGLFNPEEMDHPQVSRMLIDFRDMLAATGEKLREQHTDL